MKLAVEKLEAGYQGKTVVKDVSFTVEKGEFISLIGPSGCGKSTVLKVLAGLLEPMAGTIMVDDAPLQGGSRHFSYMPQSDLLLDWYDILDNVCLYGKIHGKKKEAQQQALENLKEFGLAGYEHAYPSQLSGGMRQRVMIAMALACEPDILIADEPTTALDVTIQAQILELMQDLQKKLGMAVILVTHDLGVIADMCDNIIVMYGGRICERGTAREIFYNPKHEYTKGLLRSIPNVNNMKKKLVPIAGTPINMLNLPAGCAFCTRCDAAMKICLSEHPEEMAINENHRAACWINVRDQLMNAEGGEPNV